ncbi:uncharacterized protein ATNIH1004_009507 [Aspergillus tanneri]|uniref:Chromo domain-containing protein n=1 Tax=Aspergillus tanneri TaxID=1220188 RepID=A0A5M9M6V7_9EURO|nr:uncharacterized protein ATNIH1004_009507 [Aspergillus tanneri]KAA8642755.1 hypothetical protein ATNIH1004_009507 [Aspergillus tanneri]
MAQVTYNAAIHSSTKTSPHEALMGFVPSLRINVDPDPTGHALAALERATQLKEKRSLVKDALEKAQKAMARQYNKRRIDRQFKIGVGSDQILEEKRDKSGNISYLVRWKGYPPDDDTWEPRSHVEDTEALDIWLTNTAPVTRRHKMAQRPNNTDLPPKETTQPLKDERTASTKRPRRLGVAGTGAMGECDGVRSGTGTDVLLSTRGIRGFRTARLAPLPAQPPSPAQQGDETGEVQQTCDVQ